VPALLNQRLPVLAPVVQRLQEMLADLADDVEVIGLAGEAATAIEAIRAPAPDAVILDIRLPRGSGIKVLETIRRSGRRHTSQPPSTVIDWPVMFFESSEARKHTALAMSCAVVTRRSAISFTYS
jgi:DNA-binding NarL/FixJ family response regulator